MAYAQVKHAIELYAAAYAGPLVRQICASINTIGAASQQKAQADAQRCCLVAQSRVLGAQAGWVGRGFGCF